MDQENPAFCVIHSLTAAIFLKLSIATESRKKEDKPL